MLALVSTFLQGWRESTMAPAVLLADAGGQAATDGRSRAHHGLAGRGEAPGEAARARAGSALGRGTAGAVPALDDEKPCAAQRRVLCAGGWPGRRLFPQARVAGGSVPEASQQPGAVRPVRQFCQRPVRYFFPDVFCFRGAAVCVLHLPGV